MAAGPVLAAGAMLRRAEQAGAGEEGAGGRGSSGIGSAGHSSTSSQAALERSSSGHGCLWVSKCCPFCLCLNILLHSEEHPVEPLPFPADNQVGCRRGERDSFRRSYHGGQQRDGGVLFQKCRLVEIVGRAGPAVAVTATFMAVFPHSPEVPVAGDVFGHRHFQPAVLRGVCR